MKKTIIFIKNEKIIKAFLLEKTPKITKNKFENHHFCPVLGGDIFWNNFKTRVQAISLWTKMFFFFSFCSFLPKAL